jgi:DNA modification methylase
MTVKPYYERSGITIYNADCRVALASLPDASVQCCITSPPYFGLRSYLDADHPDKAREVGTEQTPREYVDALVAIFREVRRVLRDDGTVWLNLGSSYAGSWGNYSGQNRGNGGQREITVGSMPTKAWEGRELERPAASRKIEGIKEKDDLMIPYRVAIAMQEDGWYVRSTIVWAKPNPMPESVTDRPTRSHEYIFLLTKSARYFYDQMAIAEEAIYAEQHANKTTSWGTNRKHPNKANVADYMYKGDNHTTLEGGKRNKRDVWTVATKPLSTAHFATFPPKLIEPCILAGCPVGGVVLDPFAGAGTTLLVAKNLGRSAVGIELSPVYCDLIVNRLRQDVLALEATA